MVRFRKVILTCKLFFSRQWSYFTDIKRYIGCIVTVFMPHFSRMDFLMLNKLRVGGDFLRQESSRSLRNLKLKLRVQAHAITQLQ